MRASIIALLALAACQVTETPAEATAAPSAEAHTRPPEPSASAPDTTTVSRAQAAGLSPEQAAELKRLGVPVYVPDPPAGWTLTRAASAAPSYDGGEAYPEYTLRYRTPQGTCLLLAAASEGLGGVFSQEPPNQRDIAAPGVPTDGPVPLGWSARGDADEGWQGGRAATELFGTDGLALHVDTAEAGCPAASTDDVAAFVATLRPLDPADDAILLGTVAPADEIYQASDMGLPTGPDPEAVALAFFGSDEPGEGRAQTRVETLRRRDRYAVVLVTMSDHADDSVRDMRTRVALAKRGGAWEIVSAGHQTRCQPGRGHSEWSASACR